MKNIFILLLSINCYSIFSQTPEVFTVSATSTLQDTNNKYSIENLVIDNNNSWAEGVSGSGIGESFTINFKSAVTFSELYIKNGYGDFKYYYENNRVKQLRYDVDGRGGGWIILQDNPGFQRIEFSEPVKTRKITFTIKDIYPGTIYNDTCLAKISFNKWNALNHTKYNESIVAYYRSSIYKMCADLIKERYQIDPFRITDTRHDAIAIYDLIFVNVDYNTLIPLQDGSVNLLIEISGKRLKEIYGIDFNKNYIVIILNLAKILKLNQKIIPNIYDYFSSEQVKKKLVPDELYMEFSELNTAILNNSPWETNYSISCYDGIIQFKYSDRNTYGEPILFGPYKVYNKNYQYITNVNYP